MGLRRLEVQLANISARRVVGVGRSARLAALHMAAGVISVRNQYIRACAPLFDRALQAYVCTVRVGLGEWMSAGLRVSGWSPVATRMQSGHDVVPLMGMFAEQLRVVPEGWKVSLLGKKPEISGKYPASSTYHTPLELTREDILAGCRTYDFAEVEEW